MSREGKLVKNTLILAIGRFLPQFSSLIVVPILTGYLTKEEYGIYDLVVVLVAFLLPVATLQIQTAAFRFLIDIRNEDEEKKKVITGTFVFVFFSSLLMLAIVFFLLPGDVSTRLYICGYFLSDILVSATGQCARGLGKNKEYSISAIISAGLRVVLILIFVWLLNAGLKGAFISLLISTTVSFIILFIVLKMHQYFDLHYFSWKSVKRLLQYSWAMVPNSMSMEVMRLSDRFIVTLVLGPATNAIYAAANKIPNILTVAQGTFAMAWQENASIVSKDRDADEYYTSMFRTMYDLMGGFLGLLICFTPLLFKILIRGDYGEAYNQMPLLFLAVFLYSMCSFLGGIYVARKDTKSVGITTMAAAVCNLVVDISLINFIGIYAASGSTFVSFLFLFLFRMFDVRKHVKIQYDYIRMLLIGIALVSEAILCYLQNPILDILNIVFGLVVFITLNHKLVKMLFVKAKDVICGHMYK